MTAVMWMAAGCAASGLAAMIWVPSTVRSEWFFGMIGPFVAVAVSWLVIDRAAARHAAQVPSVLLRAFVLKFVFFGLYVAVMLRGLALQPVPFVISFTCYFVTLYAVEAWLLQRLTSRGLQEAR